MASLGNGDLKVRTLGDLRKFVDIFKDEPDDTDIIFEGPGWLCRILLTDNIDISYSSKCITVETEDDYT